jgi:hypothetical protein
MAAIAAAINAYLEQEAAPAARPAASRWRYTGRVQLCRSRQAWARRPRAPR